MALSKDEIQRLCETRNSRLPSDRLVEMDVYSSLSSEERCFVNMYLLVDTYVIYFEPIRSGVAGIDDTSAKRLLKTLLIDFNKENVKRTLSAIAYGSATAYTRTSMADFCDAIIAIFLATDDIAKVNDKSEIYNLFVQVVETATDLPRGQIAHSIIEVCTDFLDGDDYPKED